MRIRPQFLVRLACYVNKLETALGQLLSKSAYKVDFLSDNWILYKQFKRFLVYFIEPEQR